MPLYPVEVEYCSVCSCPLEYCANAGCERVKLEKELEGASISAGDGGKERSEFIRFLMIHPALSDM